ncbi:MAG: hypothetical protein QM664_02385 [Flavihumibacter sp.]
MLRDLHTRFNTHRLKLLPAVLLLCMAGYAVASMGGEKKKKASSVNSEFVPIRTTTGFTLKAGPTYKGSFTLPQTTSTGHVNYQTLVTYSKGNTTYILPYNRRVNVGHVQGASSANSTELLKLKLRIK